MARPSQFDRDAALDIAMQELWQQGYERTSVKALCEKIGITRSSFYNAFGSREALFALVLERYLAQLPEAELLAMTKETPLAPTLTRVLRELCRERGNDPLGRGCLAVNALTELSAADGEPGVLIAETARGVVAALEERVRWAQTRGEVAPDRDAHAIALAVHGLLLSICAQSRFVHDPEELWGPVAESLRGLGLLDEGTG